MYRLPHDRTQPRYLWTHSQACPRLVMVWWAAPLLISLCFFTPMPQLTNQNEISWGSTFESERLLCVCESQGLEGESQYSHCLLLYCCKEVPESTAALLTHKCTGTGKPFNDTIPAPNTYTNTVNDSCWFSSFDPVLIDDVGWDHCSDTPCPAIIDPAPSIPVWESFLWDCCTTLEIISLGFHFLIA